MTVRLQGYARKYRGLSTDVKPVTGDGVTIPVGSAFYESDTGREFCWDSFHWVLKSESILAEKLEAILEELREIKALNQEMKDLHSAVANSL